MLKEILDNIKMVGIISECDLDELVWNVAGAKTHNDNDDLNSEVLYSVVGNIYEDLDNHIYSHVSDGDRYYKLSW